MDGLVMCTSTGFEDSWANPTNALALEGSHNEGITGADPGFCEGGALIDNY